MLLQRRGWDADLLIIDEAGWIRQPRVFKTAFPVATQKRSACIMLSTPGPENSYLMRLLKQVDSRGQPKLVVLRFGTPCDDCLKTDAPWLCRHKDESIPWIDRDKQDELAYLYVRSGSVLVLFPLLSSRRRRLCGLYELLCIGHTCVAREIMTDQTLIPSIFLPFPSPSS